MIVPPAVPAAPASTRISPAERAKRLCERKPALPTGIAPIDEAWRGGAYQDLLWIVGGPPSSGKTSFTIFLGHAWARQGVGVLYVAGDEPADRIIVRLGQHLGIDRTALEQGQPEATSQLAAHLEVTPLDVIEPEDLEPGTTLEQLYIEHRTRHPEGPAVIVLDSLQRLVRRFPLPADTGDATRSRIDGLLDVITDCVKRYKVITLLLTEFSRATYRSSRSTTVDLAGGKESGSIEYTGDALMVLRPVHDDPFLLRVGFPKSRPGVVSPFWLRQDPESATYDVSQTHPAECRYLAEIEDPRAGELEHLKPFLDAALAAIRQNPGCSTNAVVKLLGRKKAYVLACLRHLGASGKIVNLGDDRRAEWQARSDEPPAVESPPS